MYLRQGKGYLAELHKNRVEQPKTIFNDSREYTDFGDRPNPRQKRLIEVFKVIEKYL